MRHSLWFASLTLILLRAASGEAAKPLRGCLGRSGSAYVLQTGERCIKLAGSEDLASFLGMRVQVSGVRDRTGAVRVRQIQRTGQACTVVCRGTKQQEEEGSRGLKSKENPGSEGATPGMKPPPEPPN